MQRAAATTSMRRCTTSRTRRRTSSTRLGCVAPSSRCASSPAPVSIGSVLTQDEKAAAFRALHEGEAFIIPNPWDAGSAKVLEALGFKALATTSSGFAFTLGRPDGGTTLDDVAAHVAALDRATGLPVAVDLENGYGADPADAAAAVARAAEAGAVGGSI